MNSKSFAIANSVSTSFSDPRAILRNRSISASESLPHPSAMLVGMDTAALLICDVKPNRSASEKFEVSRYALVANSLPFCQTSSLRKSRMGPSARFALLCSGPAMALHSSGSGPCKAMQSYAKQCKALFFGPRQNFRVLDYCKYVIGAEDGVILAADGDFGAAVLAVEDCVALLDVDGG